MGYTILCYIVIYNVDMIWYDNYVLKDGNTALMFASFNGHSAVCELLLSKGANIDMVNKVWDVLYYVILWYVV